MMLLLSFIFLATFINFLLGKSLGLASVESRRTKPLLTDGSTERTIVILFHKPAGVVTSHFSDDLRPTVYDEVKSMKGFLSTKNNSHPSSFEETLVPPKIIERMTEIVEIFIKVDQFEKLAAEEGSADHISDKDVTFDDVYLFSLLGQVLSVREYICKEWEADCPLPSFILASRSYGRSSDSGMSAAVFDWFLKGGTKDNISDAFE